MALVQGLLCGSNQEVSWGCSHLKAWLGLEDALQRWWTHVAAGRKPQVLSQDFLAAWQLPLHRVSCPQEGTRKNTASVTAKSRIITSHLICLLEASHWVQHTFQGRGIWPHLLMGGGFPCGSAGNRSTCNAGDLGLSPGWERSPGEGKGYPLQYSGLDYIVHGVAKSWTWLSDFHFHLMGGAQNLYGHIWKLPHGILPPGMTTVQRLPSLWVERSEIQHINYCTVLPMWITCFKEWQLILVEPISLLTLKSDKEAKLFASYLRLSIRIKNWHTQKIHLSTKCYF